MKRVQGFTMVELMVTLAVAAVLMGLAAPSFSSLVQNNRILTETNALIGDLRLARSEASKRNMTVIVCPSSDGSSCSSATTDWNQRRIIFADADGTGVFNAGTDPLISKSDQAPPAKQKITASSSTAGVRFRATGQVNAAVSFTLCDGRTGNYGYLLSVDLSGRPTITKNTSCP